MLKDLFEHFIMYNSNFYGFKGILKSGLNLFSKCQFVEFLHKSPNAFPWEFEKKLRTDIN